MRQFIVIVITVVIIAKTKGLMPLQTDLFPFLEPIQLSARFYEKLHLHLLKLTHTENELTGHNFITECLTDLCNTERNFHTTCFLNIEVVHKNTLCRFRTQIDLHGTIRSRTHLCGEHQIELTHFRPVLRSGNGANNLFIYDDLAKLIQIIIVQRFRKASMKGVAFSLMLKDTAVCATELCLIESITEFLGSFSYLFIDLIIVFGKLIFDKHVCTITFFRIFIVNQRIVECINVSGSFPDSRMHKNSGVDADNIFVQQHHAIPPVFLYIIFEFNTHLTIVIHSSQSIINIT